MKTIARILLFVAVAVVAVQSEEFKMYPLTAEDKAFFEQIKKAVLADDAESLSKLIAYPLVIRPNDQTIRLENQADVKKSSALIFTAKLKSAVRSQTPDSLFKNWRGVMIGNGEIWFNEIGEKTTKGERWAHRVIAINLGRSSVSSAENEKARIQPGPPGEFTSRKAMPQENVEHYVVAKGDSTTAICRKFQISLEQLLASNPGLDVERLWVGQRVRIPKKEGAANPGNRKLAPLNDASSQESKSGVKDSAGQKAETPKSPPKP